MKRYVVKVNENVTRTYYADLPDDADEALEAFEEMDWRSLTAGIVEVHNCEVVSCEPDTVNT